MCVRAPISLAGGQAYTDLITPQAECGGGGGGCEADRNRQTRQGERGREHAHPAGRLCCTINTDLYTDDTKCTWTHEYIRVCMYANVSHILQINIKALKCMLVYSTRGGMSLLFMADMHAFACVWFITCKLAFVSAAVCMCVCVRVRLCSLDACTVYV